MKAFKRQFNRAFPSYFCKHIQPIGGYQVIGKQCQFSGSLLVARLRIALTVRFKSASLMVPFISYFASA
ncbi:MAG: hypothetical protein WDM90_11720 [Ferruginibacter sp.]